MSLTRIILIVILFSTGCTRHPGENISSEIDSRIRLDFRKSREQILQQLSRYYNNLSDSQLTAWESDGRLEMKVIDGQKRYFNYAVNNLFRIDPVARAHRDSLFPPTPDPLDSIKLENTQWILNTEPYGNPAGKIKVTFEYTLTVDADAIPAGETVRCWLPFPSNTEPRQQDVTLLVSEPSMIRSADGTTHSSLYSEQISIKGQPTLFTYKASYQIAGQWFDPKIIDRPLTKALPSGVRKFTREEPPQIRFTPAICRLADSLAGSETNPFKILTRFYTWIDLNIPWASAREYSTMDSIPDYVLQYRHGDCGMVTFLLMSMARYKGIPARWQSGWMIHPGEENLHDWCEVWFHETGWIPVDMSFGLQATSDDFLRNFYISGIDSYRMIVNTGVSGPFDPPKKYYRSEPYDFQRGEVEWSGGNLYFNHWDYHLKILSIEKISQ